MATGANLTDFSVPAVEERETLRARYLALHVSIFAAAFILLVLRRPDALTNAQFYAEDGKYWYADAYNFGWRCLLLPVGGYLNTLSRLIGMFSLLFPLLRAPLVMNVCALAMEALPINVFLSSRFNAIPFRIRLLASALYLSLPNSFEIHANTTNIQWHLALVCLLVLFGKPDSRLPWRIFDFVVLALSALDGPLGILLIPIAALLRWLREEQRYNLALLALIPPTLVQLIVMALSDSRRTAANGATVQRFINIVGGQVFVSSVLGVRSSIHLFYEEGSRYYFAVTLCALTIGMLFVIYVLRHGPLELKLFYLFAAMLLALALKHPLASFEGKFQQWELMEIPGCGNRYYFFPMLAFLATPIWMLSSKAAKSAIPRCAALIVLLCLPIGIWRDWRYRAFPPTDFKDYVERFERTAPGTRITIPIYPLWQMDLVKH
jgi:hypothetical protein